MYRKATIEDCGRVYALICDMEQKTLPYDRFRAIFERQLQSENYCCLLLEENGAVIGELNLRFEEQLHHAERIAEIMEFAMDAEYRSKGLGAGLFAHACDTAREQGCVQIEVACNQLRLDTHRFYLREGMHNFHYKFSKPLTGEDSAENALGK